MPLNNIPVIVVPANGKSDRIPHVGTFIETQDQSAPLRMTVWGRGGAYILMDRAAVVDADQFWFDEPFDHIQLENETGVDASVVLLAGPGSHRSGDVSNMPAFAGSAIPTFPDVTLPAGGPITLILPANAARRSAIIGYVTSPAAGTIRIGDLNTGAAQGTPLVAPGDVAVINTTAAVYGFNPGGAPIVVSAAEVEN